MAIPKSFQGRLALPAIAAPMFLISGPRLVIESCKAGVVGTFPALNQRTNSGLDAWLQEITDAAKATPGFAPYGVNLIVHKSNVRLEEDLKTLEKYAVPLVITSLGLRPEIISIIHGFGGVVLHDVISRRHAEKALEAGVDGVIAVSAGSGGHAGTINPFALIDELKPMMGDRTLVLAGAISTGRAIAAAKVAGADLAYLGTRLIATEESLASDEYKNMLLEAESKDIIYTPKFSGVSANYLQQSISLAGIDLATLEPPSHIEASNERKVWKSIWSAGHGVGAIHDVPPVRELIARLKSEYAAAIAGIS